MGAARLKVILSAAILMAGLALTILAVSSETTETSSGIVIDFGDGDTIYDPYHSLLRGYGLDELLTCA